MTQAVTAVRVVSLVPSVTETLLSWGVVPIAVTRFCEQPGLPAVGGTKDPDVGAVAALAPDLVVMNDEENRREDADALRATGVAVHVVHLETLEDVEPAMATLAERLELPHPPARPGLRPTPAAAPRLAAFVPIWRRPWMTLNARTYGSSLLATVGVDNVYGSASDRYPQVTLEEAADRRPDVVLAPSEPYPFRSRHTAELAAVAPVTFVDGQDLFWWGARTPQAQLRLRRQMADLARSISSRG